MDAIFVVKLCIIDISGSTYIYYILHSKLEKKIGKVMLYMQVSNWIRWLIVALAAVGLAVLIQPQDAKAELIPVKEGDTRFTEGNSLTFTKEPEVTAWEITTNIPDSRITKREHGEGSGDQFKKWHNMQQQYDNQWFEIDNVKPSDYIQVYHGNAGTFHGRPIDVQVKYTNFKYERNVSRYDSDTPRHNSRWEEDKIYFQVSESLYSGFVYYNVARGTAEYTFFDSATGEKITVDDSSYMSFNSLNGYSDLTEEGKKFEGFKDQGVGEFVNYENVNTWEADSATDAYIIGEGSDMALRQYDYINDGVQVYIGQTDDFEDKLGSDTFTNNSVSFGLVGDVQRITFGSANRNSAWQAPSSAVFFNVTAPDPIKTVYEKSGNEIAGEVIYGNQEITYEIKQKVHVMGVDILERYSNFVIQDVLPDEIEFKAIRIYDGEGEKIPDKYIKSKGVDKKTNKAHISFTDEYLNNEDGMAYEGETYTVEIDAVVEDVHQFKLQDTVIVVNTPTAIIDGITKDGPPVENELESFDAELSLDRTRIYTETKEKGLPIYLDIDTQLIKAEAWEQLADDAIKMVVKESASGHTNTLLEKELTVADLETEGNKALIELGERLPSDKLSDKQTMRYHVTFEPQTPNITTSNTGITLHGHLAEEAELTGESAKVNFNYEGPAMVERSAGEDEITHNESIKVQWMPEQDVIAGYGFDIGSTVTYVNEIPEDLQLSDEEQAINEAPDLKVKVAENLIEPTLDYSDETAELSTSGESEAVEVPFDVDKESTPNETVVKYMAPKSYIEQGTGAVFTEEQKAAGHIRGEAVDGGHRLYVPMWMDTSGLGDNAIEYENSKEMGANKITMSLDTELEVDAYMFHHMDSETSDKDALLLKPMGKDDIPEEWKDDTAEND